MQSTAQSGVYTLRRKVFKVFGAAFHIYAPDGSLLGYVKQKAFKLKEDIRVYTDESATTELMTIGARQIIDFSAAYDVMDARQGVKVGVLRRKGWASIFRDAWQVLDAEERLLGSIREDSALLATLRRFLSNLIPQRFRFTDESGKTLAIYRSHFNPFVHRMSVIPESGSGLDPRLLLAAGVLLMAVEGRQG
ncbi:MAG: hypothetical protein ACT4PV_12345 [Planctomycetaceae bacterium]